MGLWQDFWDASSHGWDLRSERAHKRNVEAGKLHHQAEMEALKRREIEALEQLVSNRQE